MAATAKEGIKVESSAEADVEPASAGAVQNEVSYKERCCVTGSAIGRRERGFLTLSDDMMIYARLKARIKDDGSSQLISTTRAGNENML